jgi:hypothetical protein
MSDTRNVKYKTFLFVFSDADCPKFVFADADCPKFVFADVDGPKFVLSDADCPKFVFADVDSPKSESRQAQEILVFSETSGRALDPPSLQYNGYRGSFTGIIGRSVKLATHLHRALSLLPYIPS